ncbi:MAG: acetyl-CoA C-acyltransferase [Leptonema sp. (in: bacteria)]
MEILTKKRRAVVVAGIRTPFVRAFQEYTKLDTIELGKIAVKGLLDKTHLPYHKINAIYWGAVLLPHTYPNIAREIALDLNLPPEIEAFTVTRACTTSLLTITLAASAIERGDADVIIAGGSESVSNAEVNLPKKLIQTLAPLVMSKKTSPLDYLKVLPQLAPFTDLLPKMPEVRERKTKQLMGESAEIMAKKNNISREEQDEFALKSHRNAAKAYEIGRYDSEIIPVTINGNTVYRDTIVRADTTLEKLSQLKPAFTKDGTITAGNASALTDGAAAVLLINQETAEKLGYEPLAYIRSWDYVGVDPYDQLLIGPAISMPNALDKANLKLEDVDLFDIHEAFAAQVLSVLKALESDVFAKYKLKKDKAIGSIPREKLNIWGGSIALGHPFAATGARMVTTMANELKYSKKKRALLGICAAGGLGAACILESLD